MIAGKKSGMLAISFALVLAAGGGFLFGKLKERDYLAALGQRSDFTLMDDSGDFFQLSKLPESTLALLVFTPDGIPVESVKPFYEISRHLGEFKEKGLEVLLVSRTNREIVRNFVNASRFKARFLVDAGGVVGRNVGVWPGIQPVPYWSYVLVDRKFQVFWAAKEKQPLSYEKLMQAFAELEAKFRKSTASL